MPHDLNPRAQRVQKALDDLGLKLEVVELPASTRTAVDAAKAIGCEVGQIVKSLIFKGAHSGQPVLVAASGANRVNEKQMEAQIGEPLGKADADFVRVHTGFAIGGVPPVGHIGKLQTFVDSDLMTYPEIWAAAGTPNAVFRLTPSDLVQMTGGTVIAFVKD
jgi:prolyl-tRNA editing enzyme YbaK/EbsC (Cys-tRNA(Pro) deacylase)